MIEPIWREFRHTDSLSDAVALDISVALANALDAFETILIALPGGTTPLPVYEKLRHRMIDWKRITIIPTDDRLVASDSPLSNATMLQHYFASLGAQIVPLCDGSQDYQLAGKVADARLHQLPWPPALVWLGVGGDGHSASIFAGPDLEAALNAPATQRVIGVMPDPLPTEAPVARVTLTRIAILSARALTMVVTGTAKRVLLEQAIQDGPLSTLPIGRILAATDIKMTIYWCP
jgi:6-phosphogluconolactonase